VIAADGEVTEVYGRKLNDHLRPGTPKHLSEYRNNATSDAEAYHMRDADEQIRSALAEQGYAPR